MTDDIRTEISRWLNYWKPKMGGDIQVCRIFSDEIDKELLQQTSISNGCIVGRCKN